MLGVSRSASANLKPGGAGHRRLGGAIRDAIDDTYGNLVADTSSPSDRHRDSYGKRYTHRHRDSHGDAKRYPYAYRRPDT